MGQDEAMKKILQLGKKYLVIYEVLKSVIYIQFEGLSVVYLTPLESTGEGTEISHN